MLLPKDNAAETTVFDDTTATVDRNGLRALPVMLASHYPLDLVVLMLGTNDLKPGICGNAAGAAAGMAKLVTVIQDFAFDSPAATPAILIVSPPHFSVCALRCRPSRRSKHR